MSLSMSPRLRDVVIVNVLEAKLDAPDCLRSGELRIAKAKRDNTSILAVHPRLRVTFLWT